MNNLSEFKNNKNFISFEKKCMDDDENLISVIKAYLGMMFSADLNGLHKGLLFCTNKKVCFHRKGLLSDMTNSIPIENIKSVDLDKELLIFSKLVIHTHKDKVILTCDNHEDTKKFKLLLEKMIVDSSKDSENNNENTIEKIRKLKELKEEGILTSEEFENKKKQLLDEI